MCIWLVYTEKEFWPVRIMSTEDVPEKLQKSKFFRKLLPGLEDDYYEIQRKYLIDIKHIESVYNFIRYMNLYIFMECDSYIKIFLKYIEKKYQE